MDYGLNEGQEMLKKTARDFLAVECPKSLVRQMAKDDRGYSLELWHKMAGLGWIGLVFPGKYGGGDGSFVDLTVLLEEMGRASLPSPFISTVILGGLTILKAGNEAQKRELLPNIAAGNLIWTIAVTEPGGGYSTRNITSLAIASRAGYVVSGSKVFVPDAHIANYIICVSRTERGITLFLIESKVPGIHCIPLKTMDGDIQCEVVFNKVKVPGENILGKEGRGYAAVREVFRKAAVAKCAEMVGGAQQVLEMTVDYVKQRFQFGQPVGAFQAVQHHCANMLIDIDVSRFLTYKAAWVLSEGLPCAKESAMAKAWVSEAYGRVMLLGHQCIGGVALMEDHDLPLYSKRAKAAEASFGDSDLHRETVALEIGL